MITEYKIFEAKQVGILYHWTNFYSLGKILEQDRMWSAMGYISFSRNKRLNYANRTILIIFDGNKMSDKFKFEPFLYSQYYKKEAEERIECNFKSEKDSLDDCIFGIKKYIIGIQIVNYDRLVQEEHEGRKYIFDKIKKLNKLIPNIKIEIIK